MASAGMDNIVRLWETKTGRLRHKLTGHTNVVEAVAFAPGGKVLATGGMDFTLRLWDIETGKQLRALEVRHHMISSLAYSADGKLLASGGWDNLVRIWNTDTWKQQFSLPGHSRTVRDLAFFPDGKKLVSAGQDRTIFLRDPVTGKDLDRIEVPGRGRDPGDRSPFAISPTGTEMAIAQGGSAVAIVDATGKKLIRRLPSVGGTVTAVAWSPDGKTLASSARDGVVRLWDADTGRSLRNCQEPAGQVNGLVFSPDSKTLASIQGCSVRLWDVAMGTPRPGVDGHFDSISCVAVDPTGALVATGSADTTVIVWDRSTGKIRHRWAGHVLGVNCVAFAPRVRLLAVGSRDNKIRLYNPDTGVSLGTMQTRMMGIQSLAFTPDGKTLLSGGADGVVRLWDPQTRKETRSIGAPSSPGRFFSPVSSLTFSPDGKLLAVGGKGESIRMWDYPSGREGHTFTAWSGRHLATFSPDGKTLATIRSGAILLWEVEMGRKLHQMQGDNKWLHALAFSPVGKLLCSGGEDGKVRLWDPVTGKEKRFLSGHEGAIRAVAFSPDGNWLISASSDSTAVVWNVTGKAPNPARTTQVGDLDPLWDDLASTDAARAFLAIKQLSEAPGPAVSLLKGQLRPVKVDRKHLRLVADLDSGDESVRKAARTELEALGHLAEVMLRRSLSNKPTLRLKEQVEELLEKLDEPVRSPERLRMLRAIETLERIGTPAAVNVLRELALGVPEAEQTREAASSLSRLERKAR